MQIDWRALLDTLHVEWIDRGKNVGSGDINIKCPLCLDDPSKHLGIALGKEAFFCYRSPNQHSGRSFTFLLRKLGQSENEAIRLLRRYRRAGTAPIEPRVSAGAEVQKTAWSRFETAGNSKECVEYLSARGYPSPRTMCEQFDLRYAPAGVWARRLLLPLHHDGEVISWTARDMTGRAEQKYLMREVPGFVALCMPDTFKPTPTRAVIVEGPMDALRIAQATRDERVISIALCGKALGAEKLLQIRKACETCTDILVTMDSDAPMSACYQTVADIRSAVQSERVGRAKLPVGIKDPGELPAQGVLQWLNEASLILRTASMRDQR